MARNRDIELDPLFFVPPGVIDVRQQNKTNTEYVYSNPSDIAEGGPILETPDSVVPNAPSGYRIVSQKQRQGADGRTVIDVELEFADIAGFDIDVRVTPA